MNKIDEYMQNEMDEIVVKTLVHVQKILDEKGQEEAEGLVLMIADGIRDQLVDSEMSLEDIAAVRNKFITEINSALLQRKH
jgi:hypothetical protein